MIFTKEQIPWTEQSAVREDQLHYIGAGKATEAEIEQLRIADAEYLYVYGIHLFDNYEDIQ